MVSSLRTTHARGKSTIRLGMLIAASFMLSSCAIWPSAGQNGALYTEVTRPIAVLDPEVTNVRTGEACSSGILGLYAAGDSSVSRAKINAGITKVSTVEERYIHYILGLYSSYCTIVSGT